jgi:hypothetical protein
VTNDEKRLGSALVGLYRVARQQQEGIDRFVSASEALLDAMKELEPRFQPVFDKYYAQQIKATSAIRAATFQMLDQTIASLQKTYEPWKN